MYWSAAYRFPKGSSASALGWKETDDAGTLFGRTPPATVEMTYCAQAAGPAAASRVTTATHVRMLMGHYFRIARPAMGSARDAVESLTGSSTAAILISPPAVVVTLRCHGMWEAAVMRIW